MSEDNILSKWISNAALLFFISFPMIFPRLSLFVGGIFWSVVYITGWAHSIMYDATKELPWTYGSPATLGAMLVTAFAFSVGYQASPLRGISMLVVWGPLLFLDTYWTSLGMGVPETEKQYMEKNYVQTSCERKLVKVKNDKEYLRNVCLFDPKLGLKLPSFYKNVEDNEIVSTIPYQTSNKTDANNKN